MSFVITLLLLLNPMKSLSIEIAYNFGGKMRIKIRPVVPKKSVNLNHIDFASWEPFAGLTEEDDLFYRMTYIVFLKTRKRTKHIYLSEN
jgi:hypothetical protein